MKNRIQLYYVSGNGGTYGIEVIAHRNRLSRRGVRVEGRPVEILPFLRCMRAADRKMNVGELIDYAHSLRDAWFLWVARRQAV